MDSLQAIDATNGAKVPVVDAHQHFWSLKGLGLETAFADTPVLDRDYLPATLRPQLVSVGVDYTVYVAGFPDTAAARDWEFALATQTDVVAGITSWVDLCDPRTVGVTLDRMQQQPKFVGLRHLVELEPDPDWLGQAAVRDSLREVADRGVCYDMLVRPIHFKHVLDILETIPDLPVVIDHIAKPDIKTREYAGWAEGMQAIAAHPQACCKLSGMVTEADHTGWKADDLKPYIAGVVEWFGWDRVMFGSDWPVCRLAAEYRQVWDALNACLGEINDEERAQLFGLNAISFYQLRIP